MMQACRSGRGPLPDWRRELKAHIPRQIDPGILAHFSHERIDQRAACRLGVDGCKVSLGKHFPDHPGSCARIDEIIDDQQLAAGLGLLQQVLGDRLEHLDAALVLVVVTLDRDALDDADVELARHDRGRHESTTGDGNQRVDLEKWTVENNLKNVTFVGAVPHKEMYHYLQQADVFVSAPKVDNMPMSVLEAFNAGLLVISSNVGGVPFLVADNSTGYLFESDNDKQFAEKMLLAVRNQQQSINMIQSAKKALECYSWNHINNYK